ncbi:MAG: hypothetical protein K0R63_16 [Rickettsiales bacterium]|nr:hypothetical protein [Rickettsiales bacterium]
MNKEYVDSHFITGAFIILILKTGVSTGAMDYQDVDGVTRATVGAGAIVVGSGGLRTLNRDVTKVSLREVLNAEGRNTVPD